MNSLKVLETKNKHILATPFQLFTYDERVVEYQEEIVVWSKEHLKAEALFYQFRAKEEIILDYLPDACVNFLFEVNNRGISASFMGIITKAYPIIIKPNVLYFGVKPYSNVGLRCREKDQSRLIDTMVSLETQFNGCEQLLQELSTATHFEERKKIVLLQHRELFLDEEERSLLAEYLSVLLCTETTAFSMETIGRETGYSERYSQRLFRKKIGITPKLYSRIIRFQNAIKAIYFDKNTTLAKVAQQLRFYDQAHLIHEFQLFTNTSPIKSIQAIVSQETNEKREDKL